MNCADLSDYYELYAMGVAEDPERSEIRTHLDRNCEACTNGMKRAAELNSLLASAAPEVRPSKKLRRRILASVGFERPFYWTWVWASAAAIALLGVVYLDNRLHRETDTSANLRRELQRQGVETARLSEALAILYGPDTAEASFSSQPAPPRGKVFLNPQRGVLLIASNLRPAPSGKLYEMWMLPKTGNPIPAGLFQSRDDGNAMNIRSGAVDLSQTSGVAVTMENQEGAAQPTSPILILAALAGGR